MQTTTRCDGCMNHVDVDEEHPYQLKHRTSTTIATEIGHQHQATGIRHQHQCQLIGSQHP